MAHRRMGLAAGTAAVGAAVAAAVIAAPVTTAGAVGTPTATLDKQCYVDAGSTPQKLTVSGTGWTPNDMLIVSDKETQIYEPATVDANGNFTITVAAPIFADTKHVYDFDTITVTDQTQQQNGVTPVATFTTPAFKYTALSVTAPSSTKHLGEKLPFKFAGFNEGSRIYGHYIYKKKLRANVDFGKVEGPCGLLDAKERIYPPSSSPAIGSYTVQFDNDPHYSSKSLPRYRFGFDIYHF